MNVFLRDGPHLRKVIGLSKYEGNQLTNVNTIEFISAKETMLLEVQASLERRFADFSSTNVIKSTKIADIQT